MQLGIVLGTATATVKHPSLVGWKVLVVQFYGADGSTPDGDPQLAVDSLGSGAGDRVVLTTDGKATRELLGTDSSPVRYSVVGIAD